MIRFSVFLERLLLSEAWVTSPSATRILWIAMFLLADKSGKIDCSWSGLARAAVLKPEEVAEGIPVLIGLNLIEPTPMGWDLVDPDQYRMTKAQRSALTQSRYRAGKKASQ